ncbi:MAG: PLP-dependent aspartate aminotransferase family protein [Bryobacteraceae bacterium]
MKMQTRAVHAGDRKAPGAAIPVTTPIVPASSFIYDDIETTDRVFGDEMEGFAYARYDNPTCHALEELLTSLEGGAGTLATSTGMAALQIAIQTAIADRRKSIVAAGALYGATVRMLMSVFEPMGVDVRWVDICDLAAVEAALAEAKPGCVILETISNPLLRVPDLERVAQLTRAAGAALIVDNTFATPLLARPLELGAHMVVHSLTKFLSGHGDVMGGAVTSDAEHLPMLRSLAKVLGPGLGAFEAYLSMRGIKTFPLRMERQCANASRIAEWLDGSRAVAKVYYPGSTGHPDAQAIGRLFPPGLRGAIVSFDLKDGGRTEVFAFMNRLRLVVKATSLGDVHTMVLYPAMSSHRDLAPKQRQRLGIGDGLVRLSAGIEAVEDVIGDLEQALGG